MAGKDRNRSDTGLGLGVGGYLNIQLSQRHEGQRWTVRLVGFLEGESVIVTTPLDDGEPVAFYSHDKVLVRYLSGREIHGFNTWVRKVAAKPYPYLHLSFPREIERVPIRQEERVPMDLPAQYQSLRQQDLAGDGRLLDLSAAGCQLKAPASLGEVGDEIELAFDVAFAGSASHIQVDAAIRNIKPHERNDGALKLYGLEFLDLDNQSRLLIRGFVYEHIIQSRE